jgi:dolichyl-phosphate beta-glucosyltransferase
MQKVCLIVPCFNESGRLDTEAFSDFLKTNDRFDLVFSDDGSSDGTVQMLEQIRARFGERVQVVRLEKNAGKGEAVRQGVLAAMTGPGYSAFGYWDADLATPLREAPRLLEYIDHGKKIVMSSRIKRMGAEVERNGLRHYVGRVFSTFCSLILQLPVYDTQCGAKIFCRETLAHFQRPFHSRWVFDVEILARHKETTGLAQAMQDIVEVPTLCWKEKPGSKMRITHLLRVPFELLYIYRKYKRGQKPES